MVYNWQQADWPEFRYDPGVLEDALFAFALTTGHMNGLLQAIPEDAQLESVISNMVAEAIKTSAIEGEFLNRQDVVSSIRNKLGLHKTRKLVKDKRALGAGELMVDVRQTYAAPLTKEKLFEWHNILFQQNKYIHAGQWRKGEEPMQVVSGAAGKEKIHFEAPPSRKVPREMSRFIHWFNDTAPGRKSEIKKAPLRAGIAHLYFESIHPFEDGNGRIGRAIAEKALSQTVGQPVLLSLSRVIEANKNDYYRALETAQRHNDITDWLHYFAATVFQAQQQATDLVKFTLQKARFFDRIRDKLNERQLKAITKMLDAGPEGFTGGMTAQKYISITRASKASATRDLQALVELGALLAAGGGRSTHYTLHM